MKSAALRFTLTCNEKVGACIAERADILSAGLIASSKPRDLGPAVSEQVAQAAAFRIISVMAAAHAAARFPLRQHGRAMPITGGSGALASLVLIPVLPPSTDVEIRLLDLMVGDHSFEPSELRQRFDMLLGQLRNTIPGGANALHFMNAALDRGIPFDWLGGNLLQFGQGAKARVMEGAFTDATSRIGTATARQKPMTSSLLRQHGLPVAVAELVHDAPSAIAAATRIGFPVVVKPADLDGGVAVQVRLGTLEQVRKATEICLAHSPNVMVEQWITGRDYRLVVFEGKLVWAIERVPGGVTGDGQGTVVNLVAEYNRNPMRGDAPHLPLKPLHLDGEALELLAEQDLSSDSVPPEGQFIRLRRAANIAMGGLALAVFEQVHPDNRLLAERAVRALGIDLAGVDLLIPDITRSWLETGAAICEVNAAPDLGFSTSAHLYPQLLGQLLPGNGRIPVILVVGDPVGRPTANTIARAIGLMGVTVGLADTTGAQLNGTPISKGPSSPYTSGKILLRDRQMNCAIICVNDCSVLDTGLPVDACDVIVLAGDDLVGPDAPLSEIRHALLQAIVPSCLRTTLIAPGGTAITAAYLSSLNSRMSVAEPSSADAVAQAIIHLLSSG